MPRYHISNDGTPRICAADEGGCPLGTDIPHATVYSLEKAREWAEEVNAQKYGGALPVSTMKLAGPNNPQPTAPLAGGLAARPANDPQKGRTTLLTASPQRYKEVKVTLLERLRLHRERRRLNTMRRNLFDNEARRPGIEQRHATTLQKLEQNAVTLEMMAANAGESAAAGAQARLAEARLRVESQKKVMEITSALADSDVTKASRAEERVKEITASLKSGKRRTPLYG